MKFDRVLVPLDGSWLAEKALPAAMAPIEAQIEVIGEAEAVGV